MTGDKANRTSLIFKRSSALVRLVATVSLLGMTVGTASSHPILVPRPTQTMADQILVSDSLVLAREDPERPFHYAALETLMGDPGSAAIDLYMPTQVRRELAANPELTALLRRDRKGKWHFLGVATSDFMAVVHRILHHADEWEPNETDNLPRLKEFSSLLGHEDVRLHDLAYWEIGRGTYASIREVGTNVSMDRVRKMHVNPIFFQWRGLDIMLLGLSDEERDRARVVKVMQQKRTSSSDLNLAAWATAYIEVEGPAGIDQLSEWYYTDSTRSRDELRSVTRALAGHANEAPELREKVLAAYNVMLDNHPYAAPDIAHDLIAWQHWELRERFQQLKPELDPLSVYKVDLYLRQARAQTRSRRP